MNDIDLNKLDWKKWFSRANDNGEGYAVGEKTDTVEEAVNFQGWKILDESRENGVALLCQRPDKTLVVVADIYGPWACNLIDYHKNYYISKCGATKHHAYNGNMSNCFYCPTCDQKRNLKELEEMKQCCKQELSLYPIEEDEEEDMITRMARQGLI